LGPIGEEEKVSSNMDKPKSADPLHGVTLEKILEVLVEKFGWEELGEIISIRCFTFDPSIKSSLTFLRKTPWARKKVEDLYLSIQR
jgi:uncharacterized protein (DUF2132 family)